MRIGGGALKRRSVGGGPQPGTRPLLARIRKSLFDILGPGLKGARVLDAFAGTGSFGLEAVSRGAAEAVLVEMNPAACGALREAARGLGVGDRVRVVQADVEAALRSLAGEENRFGVVLLDPPFALERSAELLAGAAGVVAPHGTVMLRLPVARRLPPGANGLTLIRHNRYGISAVGFYRAKGE